jgi:hypothetical protein
MNSGIIREIFIWLKLIGLPMKRPFDWYYCKSIGLKNFLVLVYLRFELPS